MNIQGVQYDTKNEQSQESDQGRSNQQDQCRMKNGGCPRGVGGTKYIGQHKAGSAQAEKEQTVLERDPGAGAALPNNY